MRCQQCGRWCYNAPKRELPVYAEQILTPSALRHSKQQPPQPNTATTREQETIMTTSPQSSLSGFFSGGGKAAKFPSIGDTIAGTITTVHQPEPQRDFETQQEIPGKTQVRIELATDARDPAIEGDDGSRTLYVRGWMTGAIGEALRKASVKEPAVGGQLCVTYVRDGQPSRPGLNGPKQYSATYTAPPGPTAQYFTSNPPANGASTTPPAASGGPVNAPIPDTAPTGIDPQAWAAMPTQAKQAIANALLPPPF